MDHIREEERVTVSTETQQHRRTAMFVILMSLAAVNAIAWILYH